MAAHFVLDRSGARGATTDCHAGFGQRPEHQRDVDAAPLEALEWHEDAGGNRDRIGAPASPLIEAMAAANASRTIGFRRNGATSLKIGAAGAAGTGGTPGAAQASGGSRSAVLTNDGARVGGPLDGSLVRSTLGAAAPASDGSSVAAGAVSTRSGSRAGSAAEVRGAGSGTARTTSGVAIGTVGCPWLGNRISGGR